MTVKKNLLFLLIVSVCISANVSCMDNSNQNNDQNNLGSQPENKANDPDLQAKIDLLNKKNDFYDNQIKNNTLRYELEEKNNSSTQIAKAATIQVLTQVAGKKIDQGIDYGIDWFTGDLEKRKQQELEIQNNLKIKEQKELKLLDDQHKKSTKEEKLLDIRAVREQIDSLILGCQAFDSDQDNCEKTFKDLYAEIEAIKKRK
ncbi:MAG TPA: hypothetical protein VLB80_05235 [Candidatus Babeliales bacterium]|nr:hypothetical protein [Candidatus Babeliales bacterium]